ncbi:phosphotransferase family protein [Actinomadura verrucosospora]|uniref:Aminoglycoside phosphotransferase n=1 Tax=Actinomadura verrucosospora TaxID=46165 RepID=A0A7D3ZKW4_ACTVE|nr:aminoglycoside phosphotransferase family protein [Actinomadura verrucosospora]QKG20963.1 aminoglycoside phosphotransferase [Actinomadura verrucosospora]
METETAPPDLFARLVEIGRDSSRTDSSRTAADALDASAEPETLYDRHGVLVVRVGDLVVKAHQPGREYGDPFLARIKVAASLPDLLLGPLGPPSTVDGRTVTLSLYGEPVDPHRELPWEDAGRLLAGLHATPIPADAPSWGRPTRVATQVARLGDGPAEDEIRRAFATLPAWVRGEDAGKGRPEGEERLIHGDWHLGQMVRARDGHWRLIDIEDLGRGDPAWDLARPAALYLSGVLHPDEWTLFLDAYAAAGGPAVTGAADPWTTLDVPARSLAIQIAATCVISAKGDERPLDGPEQAMVDACGRISAAGDAS